MSKLTFTVPETAELIGISRTSAYEAVHRGDIPSLVFGRRIVVTRLALEQLLGPLPDAARPHPEPLDGISASSASKALT